MTDESDNTADGDESTRRTVLKAGALSAGGLALGLSGTGGVAAQTGGNQPQYKALFQANDFNPGARLRIVSGVVNYTPQQTGFTAWSDYNTRIATYLNTNERFLIYPANDANIQLGEVYLVQPNYSFLPDDDQGFIDAQLIPVEDGGGGGNDSS
ncbi:hypothetical protein AUR64_09305 [Haloprofundus marisrubri]|uniref:Uncharacterized protein n=1 Tax=Haloprofundus marisrubri TaxID=1514971 RepID=A0A0W1R936_9EURY|nr:hypothetical protein [Haloprofundus marisrubri]KTG09818.1 hypothetical protein AUR64_09305 [Haloprofundus marisrubri]